MILCSRDPALAGRLCRIFPKTPPAVVPMSSLDQPGIVKGRTLLFLDLDAPAGVPVEALPGISCPCIALSATPSHQEAMAALKRGIRGYGNSFMLPENFHQCVATVKTGQIWLMPSILNQFIQNIPSGESSPSSPVRPSPLDKVSKREKEVCLNIARGLSNQEIADQLSVSLRTVKAHLTHIFQKTGCRDRLELALEVNRFKANFS